MCQLIRPQWRIVWAVVMGWVMLPTGALAQEATGALYGRVVDGVGETLPGASVSLDGPGAVQAQITDRQGSYRFLGLDPGLYRLRAGLDGFSTVEYPEIDIRAGRSVTVEIELSQAVADIILVTTESPVLDTRKLAQGSILTQIDLEAIPTARDPWAVLNQAPGVLLDRVNVGGNESAQQSAFIAPGAIADDNSFLVDGIEITDMAALGWSPTYYDFDQFAQFELSTGGVEITKLAAGVSINMVTKRGTNEFRGSARYFVTDADGYFGVMEQGDSTVDPGDLAPGEEEGLTGNRTDRNEEYGFEAGGPAWRDRAWLWASWGTTETNTVTTGGTPQSFRLENVAIKLNAQIASANSLVGSWSTGNKTASARWAGPSTAPEATVRQRGPSDIGKLEDTHLFSRAVVATGTWAKVDGGFELAANGGTGPDAPEPLRDSDGVLKRNTISLWTDRPAEELRADASYFIAAGGLSHELKFGARFREFSFGSATIYSGRQLWHYAGENWGAPPGPVDFFLAIRTGEMRSSFDYRSMWFQDTATLGSWTLNAGLRWDLQSGRNEPSAVAANPAFPELMPALEFGGDEVDVDWESICPRVGLTYALGEERKTLLRASYARFAQQLGGKTVGRVNPIWPAYGYFVFIDQNDNNMWDGYEVDGAPEFLFADGFDPTDPASVESPNRNDPGLDPPTTDELLLSAEHAFLPEFVVSLGLTYRRASDVTELRQLIRDAQGRERVVERDDFLLERTVVGDLPDGSPYAAGFYALEPGLEDTGGTLMLNGDRRREYLGATLSATKRLSDRWMLRGYVTYGRAEWAIPDSFFAFRDPTNAAGGSWSGTQSNQDNDGDVYFDIGGRWGSLMQSSWAFNLNGMYQVAPERFWGFNVAANLYGRQGYPLPYYVHYISQVDGIWREADAVVAADEFRADDLFTTDLRLEKEFAAATDMGFTFSIDAFNIFNDNTVLRRELRLTSARPDFVNETLAPRIYRLGVRLTWR